MDNRYVRSYGLYRRKRDAAWRCLIDCHIDHLPVSVSRIAGQLDIGLYAYGPNARLIYNSGLGSLLNAAGFAYMDPNGKMMIFYDETLSRQEIRFTAAHELGHILLGHVGSGAPLGRLLTPFDEKLETEADSFAIRLLAPACALWGMGAYTAKEISALCDISMEFARTRANRMHTLQKRNMWLKSSLERQLYQQFGFSVPRPEE